MFESRSDFSLKLLLNVLILRWWDKTTTMSLTGANTTPLGRLHPILAAKQQGSVSPSSGVKREAGNSEFGGEFLRDSALSA